MITFLGGPSPIMCGDCGGLTPLYRFAPVCADSHYTLYNWIWSYKAADQLDICSGALEADAEKQLTSHYSSLNAAGREFARKFETDSGKPFYYHLLRTESGNERSPDMEACPSCSRPWRLPEAWHGFEFKCEPCRLVAYSVASDE